MARTTPFARRLAAATVLGLAVRLVYTFAVMGSRAVTGDGREFHELANVLARAHRYLEPFLYLFRDGRAIPTAEKPPLYPAALGAESWLGLDSVAAHRALTCLMGAALVVLVGLLGRRVGGERVGAIAALLAAVYPALWMLDASLRSESLYAPLIVLALIAAYRLVELPSVRRAAVLGLAIGAAALTRGEAQLLLLLLALPVLWLVPRGGRVRLGAAVLAGFLVLVGPWLARNWITFNRPTSISTNEGGLLAGANCHDAYNGFLIGSWGCLPVNDPRWGTNEAVIASHLRRRAFDYASDHAGRVPAVVGVRVARVWDVWKPPSTARFQAFIDDRDLNVQRAAVVSLYLLAPLAAGGLVLLRRRGEPLRILVAPIVLVTVVAALTYGSTRFRVAAEPAIVVLASVTLDALVRRRARAQPQRAAVAA